jgi:hypothetical protein
MFLSVIQPSGILLFPEKIKREKRTPLTIHFVVRRLVFEKRNKRFCFFSGKEEYHCA